MYYIPLLSLCEPKKDEILYDLGCGSGKPLVYAAMASPQLKVCKGIEFLEGLADLAKKTAEQINQAN